MTLSVTIQRVKVAKKTRSRAQRLALMKAALIVDSDGKLSKEYFSKETIRQANASVRA
jgi:hypothetical protein